TIPRARAGLPTADGTRRVPATYPPCLRGLAFLAAGSSIDGWNGQETEQPFSDRIGDGLPPGSDRGQAAHVGDRRSRGRGHAAPGADGVDRDVVQRDL